MKHKAIPLGNCSCGASLTTTVDYVANWGRYQHGSNPECVIELSADLLVARHALGETQPIVNKVAEWIFTLHAREGVSV